MVPGGALETSNPPYLNLNERQAMSPVHSSPLLSSRSKIISQSFFWFLHRPDLTIMETLNAASSISPLGPRSINISRNSMKKSPSSSRRRSDEVAGQENSQPPLHHNIIQQLPPSSSLLNKPEVNLNIKAAEAMENSSVKVTCFIVFPSLFWIQVIVPLQQTDLIFPLSSPCIQCNRLLWE